MGGSVVSSAPTISGRRFKSHAHSLSFFNLYYWNCNDKKDENKQKGAGIGPF